MTELGSPARERRRHPRQPAGFAGRVWYGPQGMRWADCTLQDLSFSGVRIQTASAEQLPLRVVFAHSDAPAIFLAVVKWRGGDAAGLFFDQGFALEDCIRPPLDRIAEEWRALYGGGGAPKAL